MEMKERDYARLFFEDNVLVRYLEDIEFFLNSVWVVSEKFNVSNVYSDIIFEGALGEIFGGDN
jgi:uncharacterized protein (DUF1919 family)